MKEIVGKSEINQGSFLQRLVIDNNEVNDKTEIANSLNKYFANIGPNLAAKISNENTFGWVASRLLES